MTRYVTIIAITGFVLMGPLDRSLMPTATLNASPLEIDVVNPCSSAQNERKPQALVLHYTALDCKESLNALMAGVSAHYLVHPDGKIQQLVDESRRAWHAGSGRWGTITDLNSASIGIEIVHWGFENKLTEGIDYDADSLVTIQGSPLRWFPWSQTQLESVKNLCLDILGRWNKSHPQIQPWNVIGHSDLAPGRKHDPGALFPWEEFAEAGVGLWYDLSKPPSKAFSAPKLSGDFKTTEILWFQKHLNLYGYSSCPINGKLDEATKKVTGAFHLHFRADDLTPEPDQRSFEILARICCEKFQP